MIVMKVQHCISFYSQAFLAEFEASRNRGLRKSELSRLRTYRHRGSSAGSDDQLPAAATSGCCESQEKQREKQTSCVVCLQEFEPRQLLRSLPCAHEFHARCIDKWLRVRLRVRCVALRFSLSFRYRYRIHLHAVTLICTLLCTKYL